MQRAGAIMIDALLEINADLVDQITDLKDDVARLQKVLETTQGKIDAAYLEFNTYLERNFQPGLYLPDDLRQAWEAFQKVGSEIE